MDGTLGKVGQGRLVLVVEDNSRSRRLVRDLLELHGFESVDVETAEEGLEAVKRQVPALVLLDVQLPGMDGVAALRLLRADACSARVPVIAVTAYAMRGDEERFLADGFDDYISKPIDVRSFIGRLRRVLGDEVADEG
jgi:CheY-like chemotaxis protein